MDKPKRAFISGAGSGLGKAFACQLSKEGWTLGLCDKDEHMLLATARSLENQQRVYTYCFDVSDAVAFNRAGMDFLTRHKGIDLLINNAGIGLEGIFDSCSQEDIKRVIDVNVLGVMNGIHVFLPAMKEANSGTIINISSAAAITNIPTLSVYSASKAAVLSFSESLYAELKKSNIHVSAAVVSFFQSELMNKNDKESLMNIFIRTSTLTAEKVAGTILKKAFRKTFLILIPKRTIAFYYIKRFSPALIYSINGSFLKRKESIRKRLSEKLNNQI